eukprot:COSAG05_NODE_415_length_10036_cov_4.015397_2_plen_752_part_00
MMDDNEREATTLLTQRFSALSISEPELSTEQEAALGAIVDGSNVFVTGCGGTGKSVLLRRARQELIRRGKQVAVVAPTGVAAQNVEGTTIHAAAGCGAPNLASEFGTCNSKEHRTNIQGYDALIIDETSMVSGEFFDRLSEHFASIRKRPSEPFGGLQIICLGDFLQLPPIDNTEQRRKSRKGFCPALFLSRGLTFQSWTWGQLHLQMFELKQVFRQSDMQFVGLLQRLRLGDKSVCADLQGAVEAARRVAGAGTAASSVTTKLVSTNNEAERINSAELRRLRSEPHVFNALDRVVVDRHSRGDPCRLEEELMKLWKASLEKQCRALKQMVLKEGAQVMMLRNTIIQGQELVNGSRGVVVKMEHAEKFISSLETETATIKAEAEATEGTDQEKEAAWQQAQRQIEQLQQQLLWIRESRGSSSSSSSDTSASSQQQPSQPPLMIPVVVFRGHGKPVPVLPQDFSFRTVGLGANIRLQLPLTLAWALTIHKSQGMTLDQVEIDASRIFVEGQAYVAISRCRSLAGLSLIGLSPLKVQASPLAKAFYDAIGGDAAASQTSCVGAMPLVGGGWWMEQPQDRRGGGHAVVLADLLRAECGVQRPTIAEARGVLCLERMQRKATDQQPSGSGGTQAMMAFYCESCSRSFAHCQRVQSCVKRTTNLTLAPSPRPQGQQRRHHSVEEGLVTSSTFSKADWTVVQVEGWLRAEMQLDGLADAAIKEKVDGKMAMVMTREDWIELGATGLKAAKLVSQFNV